jgi:uncharacterized repeat protein (TIGR01451 family)
MKMRNLPIRLALVVVLPLLSQVVSAGPAYDFRIVALSGGANSTTVDGQPLASLKDGPAINDAGKLVFVGTYAGGQAVLVADTSGGGSTTPTVLDRTPGREFGGVWINNYNNNQACARYRTISPATFSGIKRYTLVGNAWQTEDIAKASTAREYVYIPPGQISYQRAEAFDQIEPDISINNFGFVAFTGLYVDDYGVSRYYLTETNQYHKVRYPPDGAWVFSSLPSFKPVVNDYGNILVRAGNNVNSPIMLYSADWRSYQAIAGQSQFSVLGASPGMSHDGKFIAFYGQSAAGPNIFLSVEQGGSRSIYPLTQPSDSFNSFVVDARIAVGSNDCGLYSATIAFLAPKNSKLGLYTVRVLRQTGPAAGGITVAPPVLVAQAGDTIQDSLNPDFVVRGVNALGIQEQVNGQGQVAFWAGDAAGVQAIVVADPKVSGFHQRRLPVDLRLPGSSDFEEGVPDCFGYPRRGGACTDGRDSTAKTGCLLCSAATMLNSVGVTTTPEELNTLFTFYMGYAKRNKLQADQLTFLAHRFGGKMLSDVKLTPSSYDSVLQSNFCDNRRSIILQLFHKLPNGDPELDTNGNLKPHYVFLAGRTDTDWLVFDPALRAGDNVTSETQATSLRQHLEGFWTLSGTYWGFTLFNAILFDFTGRPAVITSVSRVHVNARSPVDVLVRDPIGRALGNDGSGGADVFDIPEGVYFRDFGIGDDEGNAPSEGDVFGHKSAIIPSPLVGTYLVQLVGLTNGSYDLTLEIEGPGGRSKVVTFTGTTDVGVVSNYSLSVPVIGTADLGVSLSASTNVVNVGSNLTYSIGIVNLGPSNATAVTLMDTLPPYATFVGAEASQGSVTQAYGVVECDLGDLPMGGGATVAITVTATSARPLTNVVTLMAFEADPNPTNNIATAVVSVLGMNPPPIAVNDFATTTNGSPVVINVLANDISTNGVLDPSTLTVTRSATNGTTSVDAYTGAVTYTPNAGFTGTDTFQYTVQDDLGSISSAATVTVVAYGPPQQLNLSSPPYWIPNEPPQPGRYPMLNNLGGFVYNRQVGGRWQVFGTPSADVNPGQLTVPEGSYTEALSPAIADDGSFVCTRSRTNIGAAGQMVLTDVLRYPSPAAAATNPSPVYVYQANDQRNVNGYGYFWYAYPHASASSTSNAIFSYYEEEDLMFDSYSWSYLVLSDRGAVSPGDVFSGDYPDVNAADHFVYQYGSQIYLDNQAVLSGQIPRINDAPRDNPEIVYVNGGNLSSSRVGQLKDYNNQALTGSWVDINRSGVLIFEKLVGTNYQIFKAYPTEPRIISTGGTNALVGLPYRYDSDNFAEAYGSPEPNDPRNITPIYWSRVSGPAGFHIDPSTGHIDWIPDVPGTYTIIIGATFTYLDDLTEVEDQQTLTIQVAQSTIDVVDAVDFRSGNSPDVFSDPTQYLSGGTARVGAAADGASRLALRVMLKGAETNSFPNLHFAIGGTNQIADGLLRPITTSNWAADVPASIGSAGATNWAVGLYQSPADFDIASQPIRVVLLNGTNVIASQSLLLRRPPVVLVHDQWSSPDEFGVLYGALADAGLDVAFADYTFTSGGSFSTNVPGLYETVADAIGVVHQAGFAGSRVDLVGHGAGGILARLHAQRHSSQGVNYGLGDVHKLITIGSPHGGSWLASVVATLQTNNPPAYANLRSAILSASQASGYVPAIDLSGGALGDESYGSAALADLQGVAVPSHAIATTGGTVASPDIYSFLQFCLGLTVGAPGGPATSQNDGFITVDGQTGGVATSASTLLTNIAHLWQPTDTNVVAAVVGLLSEPVAGSARFAFFPAGASGTNPPLVAVAQTNWGSWLVLSGLTNGQSVFAGQSATITATASDARPVQSVQFLSPAGTFVDTAAPWNFSFTVPTNAAGVWRVMAAAHDTNGQLATALLLLNVTNGATLQAIQVDPSAVSLTSVAPFALHVWGLYSDGVLRDITDGSAGTKYKSSDRFQISVSTNGVLTATGNTTTNITISITNGVVFTNVVATANLFNLPPAAIISADRISGPSPFDVQFSGATSSDPEAGALTYLWDFGDGTTSIDQIPLRHRFIVPGGHAVGLTVADPGGLIARETFTVTVEPWFLMIDSSLTLTQRLSFNQTIVTNGGSLTASLGLDCGSLVLNSSTLKLGSNSTAAGVLIQGGQLFATNGLAAADIAATNAVVVLTGINRANNVWLAGGQFSAVGDLRFVDVMAVSNTMSFLGSLTTRDFTISGGTNVFGGALLSANSLSLFAGVLQGVATKPLNLVVTNTLAVSSNSVIDVTGKGYAGGVGIDTPTNGGGGPGGGYRFGNAGGGGSHGGVGGYRQQDGTVGPSALAYGSFSEPTDFGSGGSSGWWVDGGAGGGAIRIAAGQLTVSGGILANGVYTAAGDFPGAGAGGSIYITAGVLQGLGNIQAKGGDRSGSGNAGGGGRVAVYYSDRSGFAGKVQAVGGTNANSVALAQGGAGTVFWKKASDPYGELVIDNGGSDTVNWSTPLTNGALVNLQQLTIAGNARVRSDVSLAASNTVATGVDVLQVAAGSALGDMTLQQSNRLTLNGAVSCRNLSVAQGSILTLSDPLTCNTLLVTNSGLLTVAPRSVLALTVANALTVSSNSVIDVTGKGYAGGVGIDTPTNGGGGPGGGYRFGNAGGGGSHGGVGGYRQQDGTVGPSALAYGSFSEPTDFGSGGSSGWWVDGGAGGGAIRIAAGQLTVSGGILANGVYTAAGDFPGAGAGGSIYITAGVLQGLGNIQAKGGDRSGSGNAGGGGRVAVYYSDRSGFAGKVQAVGGTNANSVALAQGGAGTVFWKKANDPYGELVIDNGGSDTVNWSTPLPWQDLLRLNSWTITGNARVSFGGGVRVVNGSPSLFSGLISSGYLQVGGLLVSTTWVYGDVIEPVMSRSNGVPLVTVYCRPQKTYVLLATTNFVDWSAVGAFTPTDSSFTFADTNAPSFGKRFFRAVMLDYLYDSIGISYNRTNQQAGVTLTGAQPNHTLVLQASDNLRNWTGIASVIPSGVTNWQFLDTNAPSFQKRFYRAVGQGR